MSLSRLLSLSFFTMALFFLSSCNDSADKTATDEPATDSATATTAAEEPVSTSTIVTTPQAMFIVRHKVSNFTKWLPSYESHDSMRLANGLHNYVVGRGVDDSNTVLVSVKADDIAKAKAFSKDASLKSAMQKGGVTGMPSFNFVTVVFQDTVKISSDIRSMTKFTVKDWDAWQKAFAEGKQERIDNGLTDRVYGHDADDNKKVMLVTAIIDTAKAAAYWKSDMLKKRREAGGVIGVPERFVFRVVKRY